MKIKTSWYSERLERDVSVARWGEAGARLLSVSPGIIDTPMGRLEDANEPIMVGQFLAGQGTTVDFRCLELTQNVGLVGLRVAV